MSSYTPLSSPIPIASQNWPAGTEPLLSIWVAAYNHRRYIEQAVDSFLMQETTFPVEIILHDDASTDGTSELIAGYAQRFPNAVVPIIQPENLIGRGVIRQLLPIFVKISRGRFISYCDGDDYWTTPHKVQQQLDVLVKNDDVMLCYHSHQNVDSEGRDLPTRPPRTELEIFPQGDFIRGKFGDLTTASLIYRRTLIDHLPSWYFDFPFGDINLYAWASLKGRIAVIPGIHSAYRRHAGGMVGAYHTEQDEERHFREKLKWSGHICRLYDLLIGEADEDILAVCRARAYREHLEAAWLSRIAGDYGLYRQHLMAAFRVDPSQAFRSLNFWKQGLLSIFPKLDTRRQAILKNYRTGRDGARASSASA
jgi:glycosyltransferase involved in cell wall biosynthesis